MEAQGNTPPFPWAKTSFIKGNLAVGHLRDNLRIRLTHGGRVHIETLLTAIGALAGFASQNAFWLASGLRPEGTPPLPSSRPAEGVADAPIFVAHALSGERFFFGGGLNAYLSGGDTPIAPWALWQRLRGALVSAGVSPERHEDVEAMYAYVAGVVGTPQFGMPSTPDHAPAASAAQLARGLWPFFRSIVLHPPPGNMGDGEPDLCETHWPAVAIMVAGTYLGMSKDVLDPAIGARLTMEAAIAGSKIDPATVPLR